MDAPDDMARDDEDQLPAHETRPETDLGAGLSSSGGTAEDSGLSRGSGDAGGGGEDQGSSDSG